MWTSFEHKFSIHMALIDLDQQDILSIKIKKRNIEEQLDYLRSKFQ